MSTKHLTGVELIERERIRQLEKLEYHCFHDDDHDQGELAFAAVCYATPASHRLNDLTAKAPLLWPFEAETWRPKPRSRVRELVKAGALIAAEIDRLQRRKD